MFYEQSFISNLLKCQQCKQSYDEYDQPRVLPCCGKTICQKCLNLLIIQKIVKSLKYKCLLCLEESYVPNRGFPINELAARLVCEQPKEIYRGEECEKLKLNLANLEQLKYKLSFEIQNSEDLIKEHCIELKRLIQLAAEQRIDEIHTHNEYLIQQVNEYEKVCMQNRDSLSDDLKQQASDTIAEIDKFLNDQRDYLKRFQINDKETIVSNDKMTRLRSDLERERINVKKTLFNGKIMMFESNKFTLDETILGHVKYEKIDSIVTVSLNKNKFIRVDS